MESCESYVSITFPHANLPLSLLIDTGVTYSAMSSDILAFHMVKISTGCILSQPSAFSFSITVPIQVGSLTEKDTILLSLDSPINLREFTGDI